MVKYEFIPGLKEKLSKKYPYLSEYEINLVLKALKDYFYFCFQAGKKMVSMPSQIVDEAWHNFILFTREYQHFCDQAFGEFLHHTPAEAMTSPTVAQSGIKLAWKLACRKEKINPQKATRLPLLFEIDKRLNIEAGFYYELDCLAVRKTETSDQRPRYCVNHITNVYACSSLAVGESSSPSHYQHHIAGDGHDCGVTVNSCCSDSGGGCGGGCSGG